MDQRVAELTDIVQELIGALHLQTQELERVVSHLESLTTPLRSPSQLSVVLSAMSALQVRLERLKKEPQEAR